MRPPRRPDREPHSWSERAHLHAGFVRSATGRRPWSCRTGSWPHRGRCSWVARAIRRVAACCAGLILLSCHRPRHEPAHISPAISQPAHLLDPGRAGYPALLLRRVSRDWPGARRRNPHSDRYAHAGVDGDIGHPHRNHDPHHHADLHHHANGFRPADGHCQLHPTADADPDSTSAAHFDSYTSASERNADRLGNPDGDGYPTRLIAVSAPR